MEEVKNVSQSKFDTSFLTIYSIFAVPYSYTTCRMTFLTTLRSASNPHQTLAKYPSYRFSSMGVGKILRKGEAIGFKQLFDKTSSTFTYLLCDTSSKDAVIVDPVDVQVDRDMKEVTDLGLKLVYGSKLKPCISSHVVWDFGEGSHCEPPFSLCLSSFLLVNTHAHADHITGTGILKQKIGGFQSVISKASQANADLHVEPGDRIMFGARSLQVRATPGHTEGCVSYVADDESFVLTGDTLLIQGCGRTDFQGGSADTLYDSVYSQLFTLPASTTVYPGHDYSGRFSSTIGKESETNPRLGKEKTKDEFLDIMKNLKLSYPKKIDVAVPANMRCGVPDVE